MAEYTSSLANQMKMRDRDMVPRVLVIAMFGMMAASLALVTFAQLTDQPQRGVYQTSDITSETTITLTGTRNDGVRILDATGAEIAFSQEKRAGFIDVIWVGVKRNRMLEHVEGNPPLRLVRYANGHTAIIDPATDWSIPLIGYGADNTAAFARLLD